MSVQDVVRDKYASVAKAGLSTNQDSVRAVAEAFGYSSDELASIPAEANMVCPVATRLRSHRFAPVKSL